jgi:predicted metal-dependent HD superfamily phosphohydrolase
MIDLDLAGLASDNYVKNSVNIRKEYHMFSDELWLLGRQAFLNKFINRKIYQTELGCELWETRAKLNLADELVHIERKLFKTKG